jgi:predicted RNA-binding Zn ribbon-like protein
VTICKTGLLFADALLSHRQLEVLFLVGEFDNGADRKELTDDLFDRYQRARQTRGEHVLSGSERASLSRSIKRLIDLHLVQRAGNQLSLTDNGRQFLDSLKTIPAFSTYLEHYGKTWCKRARRAAGLDADAPRVTLADAARTRENYLRQKYGL